MHPESPPLTVGGTVLKKPDDLDILHGSDIRLQDGFEAASSFGFQSSFLMAWHLEEVVESIP